MADNAYLDGAGVAQLWQATKEYVAANGGIVSAAAESLLGDASTAQWATRESAGSGAARVESVQGAAVAFNQLVQPVEVTNTVNGVRFVRHLDGTLTASGTTTSNYAIISQVYNFVGGHKYAIKGCPNGGSASGYRAYVVAGSNHYDYGSGNVFAVASSAAGTYVEAFIPAGTTVTDLVFKPQLYDLTQMFGAGNEPATMAEFERMYPEAYYPYSAPTLRPAQIAGIASTDAQGGELYSVEWEAQTLRAAGSVRDELTAGELVTRVGAVADASALRVNGFNATSHYITLFLPTTGANTTSATPNVTCIGFTATPTLGDKHCYITSAGTLILLCDNSWSTQADALAALSGVAIFYELATPTTTPISPALDMTYRVEQGGTESIIVPEGEISAAPVLTIAYGGTKESIIMDALAAIAAPDGPTATSNHAINTYLTMGGKLYKVTRAIASGETIASGTNVTETTVMAELLALAN